jgi:hypothetical protein
MVVRLIRYVNKLVLSFGVRLIGPVATDGFSPVMLATFSFGELRLLS